MSHGFVLRRKVDQYTVHTVHVWLGKALVLKYHPTSFEEVCHIVFLFVQFLQYMTYVFPRLGETCSHIAAVLFKVEIGVRIGLSTVSSTSEACRWNKSFRDEVRSYIAYEFWLF